MSDRVATLRFEREAAAPVGTLWQAWTAPVARAVWAAPSPDVTVEFTEADTRPGGREVSFCKVAGRPDVRCEVGWLELAPAARSVNTELVSSDGATLAAALVTATFAPAGAGSRVSVAVELSSLADDMAAGYREGFEAGLDNLVGVAERTMVIERVIRAPRAMVWGAWMNPEALPQWWGPNGYSCRTKRIDLRTGGEWVFDMIAADGTVYPNHHLYREVRPDDRIAYTLLWGENGPRHADAWVTLDETADGTRVTLGMVMNTAAEFRTAMDFGAQALGLETLGKLSRFVGTEAD